MYVTNLEALRKISNSLRSISGDVTGVDDETADLVYKSHLEIEKIIKNEEKGIS